MLLMGDAVFRMMVDSINFWVESSIRVILPYRIVPYVQVDTDEMQES